MAYNKNTNYANERKYLNNLISGGGGNAEWAKNQMKELNSAEQKYGNSGGGSSGGGSGGGSSGGGSGGSSGGGSRTTPDGFQGSATGVRTNYEDQDAIRERMNENSKRWHSASDEERERLHAENERLADQINQTGGDVSFDPATGTWTGTAGTRRQRQVGYGGGVSTPTISGLTNRAPDLTSTLDKWLAAAREQAKLQADYATKTGIDELKRAEEDAQAQFQTQRNQIEASRAKASDNQVLYNERRGDRGGIGAAQYDSIANTAAQNQLAVNQAQVKLSTDTARQIADLRAQGEFQKADALLQLSQTYLQQLISIQQWGAEFNLSVDQFNKQLEQWNYEFELKVADLLGNYRGQQTLASKQYDFDREYKTAGLIGTFRGQQTLEARAALAEAGIALAQAGIQPSASQLEAMRDLYGYDENAVSGLVQTAKLAQQAKLKSQSTGSETSGGK